jgi:hypothetical protein
LAFAQDPSPVVSSYGPTALVLIPFSREFGMIPSANQVVLGVGKLPADRPPEMMSLDDINATNALIQV